MYQSILKLGVSQDSNIILEPDKLCLPGYQGCEIVLLERDHNAVKNWKAQDRPQEQNGWKNKEIGDKFFQ